MIFETEQPLAVASGKTENVTEKIPGGIEASVIRFGMYHIAIFFFFNKRNHFLIGLFICTAQDGFIQYAAVRSFLIDGFVGNIQQRGKIRSNFRGKIASAVFGAIPNIYRGKKDTPLRFALGE